MQTSAAEKNVLSELQRINNSDELMAELIKEAFYGGMTECTQSDGTLNASLYAYFSKENTDDPGILGLQAKALGWFTRGLRYVSFIQEMIKTKNYEKVISGIAVLQDKGFNTELILFVLEENFGLIMQSEKNIDFESLNSKLEPLRKTLRK